MKRIVGVVWLVLAAGPISLVCGGEPSLPEGAVARLGSGIFMGAVEFSPDGEHLAVATQIGVALFQADTFQPIRTLIGPIAGVEALAFSPDGKHIAAGTNWRDGSVYVWSVESGCLLQTLENIAGHGEEAVFYSPDGSLIATRTTLESGLPGIMLWDAETGAPTRTLVGGATPVSNYVFSSDGTTLISGTAEGDVLLWSIATGEVTRILEGHTDSVVSVALSPDGVLLATGSVDNSIRVWNSETDKLVRTLEGHEGRVASLSFSPHGDYLVSAAWDHTVRVWSVASGEFTHVFEHDDERIATVSLSTDGGMLAIGGEPCSPVTILDVSSGEAVHHVSNPVAYAQAMSFSADGQSLIVTDGHVVQVWDVRTLALVSSRSFNAQYSGLGKVGLTRNGSTLTFHGLEGIEVWDLESDEVRCSGIMHGLRFDSLAISPAGSYLAAVGFDGEVRAWSTLDCEQIMFSPGMGGSYSWRPLVFSSDEVLLATQADASCIVVRDVASGELVHRLCGPGVGRELAYSPTGEYLASTANNWMSIWDTASGEEIHRLRVPSFSYGWHALVFSPDGKLLASGHGFKYYPDVREEYNCVRIWDVASGQLLLTRPGHTDMFISLAFSPDGTLLASNTLDGSILFWDVSGIR